MNLFCVFFRLVDWNWFEELRTKVNNGFGFLSGRFSCDDVDQSEWRKLFEKGFDWFRFVERERGAWKVEKREGLILGSANYAPLISV